MIGIGRWLGLAVAHANQHAGRVVLAAAFIRRVNKRVACRLQRRKLQQDAANLSILHVTQDAVGGQQQHVAAGFLIITRFKLLYPDWRGYLVSLFALVYASNFYIGLFGHVKLEVRKNRAEIKAIEAEVEEKVNGKKAA